MPRHPTHGLPHLASEDRSQSTVPSTRRRTHAALTNQVPAADVGNRVDVRFDAPALRAYGPDQPRGAEHVA